MDLVLDGTFGLLEVYFLVVLKSLDPMGSAYFIIDFNHQFLVIMVDFREYKNTKKF